MAELRFNLLGGFGAHVDDKPPLTLPTRKARALLAVVATAPGMKHGREGLAGMLWERSAEEQARATLRQTLSSIRKALSDGGADEVLYTNTEEVGLDPDRCWVDARAFEALVEDSAPDALNEACRLYKGDFLAGLSLREESFENWLAGRRYRLRELARRTFGSVLRNLLDNADHDKAADIASHLLAIDPLQEDVHRTLMRIHLAEGRRASALHQFETCRDLLERELQIEPEAETRALAESIRAEESRGSTDREPAVMESSGSEAPAISGSPGPRSSFAGEVRPVTVLFAGLSADDNGGSIDIEQQQRLSGRFTDWVARSVSKYGGRVEKQLGDTAVAVFGVPTTSGNDSNHALRAALDIREFSSGNDLQAAVQVGVATGQAVVSGSGSGYTLVGDTVNLAHRLETMAAADSILATGPVCDAAARFVEHTKLATEHVMSRGRGISVHRVESIRSEPESVRSTRFIGRSSELNQLESVLTASTDNGFGQVVFIRGEPGIGKTRLTEEAEGRGRARGYQCHKAIVYDFGTGKGEDVPSTLVRSLVGIGRDHTEDERVRCAEAAVESGRTDANGRVFLYSLLDLPMPTELHALYDAMDDPVRDRGRQALVIDLIQSACVHCPVLILVEDIHWASRMMLNFLAAVAKGSRDCRAVLMLTSRVEGDPLDWTWRTAVRETPLFTLDLGPLREAEAASLAKEIAGAPERTVSRCLERAEGNPLFLEQLLRMSEEQGAGDAVPGTVQELALARSDRLAPEDKAALQAASAIGQRFSPETLRHLTGDPQYECRELVDKDLVRPGQGEFLFAHALIRDGIYASLLPSTRRALHRSAAEWFESRDPVLFARHLEAAEDERAPSAYLDAAKAEAGAYRNSRALELLERGLATAARADRFGLLHLKGEIRQGMGPLSESVDTLAAAAKAAPDDQSWCAAMTSMAVGLRQLADFDRASSVLDEVEPVAERNGLFAELSRIHITRANLAFRLGRTDECLPHQQRALQYARRAGSRELEIHALGGLGDAYYAMGRMRTAQRYLQQCIDEARNRGLKRIESAHLIMNTEYWLMELEKNENKALETADMAARIGYSLSEMHCYLNISQAACARHDPPRAREYAERALEIAEQVGTERFKARALHFLGQALLAANRYPEARSKLEEALSLSKKTGPGYCGPAIIGTLVLAERDAERRRVLIEEGNSLLEKGAVAYNFLEFYRDVMEACMQDRDWSGAECYAAALETFFAPEPLPLVDHLVARGRALSAYGRGRRDDGLREELQRIREEAADAGFEQSSMAIDESLRSWQADP